MRRCRLRCPEHGVLTEAVSFARPGSGFTRDFEDLVVWLVTKADKTTVATFARVAWRKHHKYLTLVSDHDTSRIVWGSPGKNAAALGRFFDDLPAGGVAGSRRCRWTWSRPMPRR